MDKYVDRMEYKALIRCIKIGTQTMCVSGWGGSQLGLEG